MCSSIDQIVRTDETLIKEFLIRANSKQDGCIFIVIDLSKNPDRIGDYCYEIMGEYLVSFNFKLTNDVQFKSFSQSEDFQHFIEITKVVGDIPVVIMHGSHEEGWKGYRAVYDKNYTLRRLAYSQP